MEKLEDLQWQKQYINETFEDNGILYVDAELPLFRILTKFEENGWDIIIQTDDNFCKSDCPAFIDCSITINKIAIEIKPTIDEKYYSFLRQMKSAVNTYYYKCLVYETFNVETATIEQVKDIFSKDEYKVYSFADIEIEKSKMLLKSGAYPIFCVNDKISLERNPFFPELNGKLV